MDKSVKKPVSIIGSVVVIIGIAWFFVFLFFKDDIFNFSYCDRIKRSFGGKISEVTHVRDNLFKADLKDSKYCVYFDLDKKNDKIKLCMQDGTLWDTAKESLKIKLTDYPAVFKNVSDSDFSFPYDGDKVVVSACGEKFILVWNSDSQWTVPKVTADKINSIVSKYEKSPVGIEKEDAKEAHK